MKDDGSLMRYCWAAHNMHNACDRNSRCGKAACQKVTVELQSGQFWE